MFGNFNVSVFPGARFGMLTVIERLPKETNSKGRNIYRVLCKCDCGNEARPAISSMVSGASKSCGCRKIQGINERARKRALDANGMIVAGAVFGRLTVIERIEKDNKLTESVHCRCECGNETLSNIDGLKHGTTKSCGCLASEMVSERNRKTAKRGRFPIKYPRTYSVWYGMLRRCFRTKEASYVNYGAKGVTVCEYLRSSPWNFLNVIGPRKNDRPTVDRYPIHNGNYTCGECEECKARGWKLNIRWASNQEQMLNRGDLNVWITAFGTTKAKSQWVRESGLGWSTLNNRLKRGWPIEKALTTPNKHGHCYKP